MADKSLNSSKNKTFSINCGGTIPPNESKVACIDLEGTVVEGSIWRDLNEAFGVSRSTADDLLKMFLEGIIEYDEWANTLVEAWKMSSGEQPSKENVVKHAESFEILEGGPELIETLNAEGYFTISISGAPDVFSRNVSQELGVDIDIPTQEIVYNDEQLVEKVNIRNDYDFCKGHILRDLRDQNDFEEIIAVGDGLNDLEMCREANQGFIVWREGRKGVNYEKLRSDGVFVGSLSEICDQVRV